MDQTNTFADHVRNLFHGTNQAVLTKDDFKGFTTVYVGKDNWCRCGCGGNYYEFSDRMFKTAVTKCMNMYNDGKIEKVEFEQGHDEFWVNFSYGNNKCFCFYAKN